MTQVPAAATHAAMSALVIAQPPSVDAPNGPRSPTVAAAPDPSHPAGGRRACHRGAGVPALPWCARGAVPGEPAQDGERRLDTLAAHPVQRPDEHHLEVAEPRIRDRPVQHLAVLDAAVAGAHLKGVLPGDLETLPLRPVPQFAVLVGRLLLGLGHTAPDCTFRHRGQSTQAVAYLPGDTPVVGPLSPWPIKRRLGPRPADVYLPARRFRRASIGKLRRGATIGPTAEHRQ